MVTWTESLLLLSRVQRERLLSRRPVQHADPFYVLRRDNETIDQASLHLAHKAFTAQGCDGVTAQGTAAMSQ